MHTKSDSAFQFQLALIDVMENATLYTAPAAGSCANMGIRNFGIAIYNTLDIRYVLFNNTLVDFSTEADGVNGTFVYLSLNKMVTDFAVGSPIDVVITVRGQVDSLCPANEYFHTGNACEYVIHGREADSELQCCPHGLTRGGAPLEECCIDDLPSTPFRIEYLASEPSPASTTFDFAMQLVTPVVDNDDGVQVGECDRMTLDYASIQIYTSVEVEQVVFDGRIMAFNYTNATRYSKWLNINGINRFPTDFDANNPTAFEVTVAGFVREPCPGTFLFGGTTVACEYTLHGHQGASTCCPHGLTRAGNVTDECSCRDDLAETPFRLGYDLATPAVNRANTTFAFNVDVVNPASLPDFDGVPDAVNGVAAFGDVNCSAMGLKAINLAVYSSLEVQQVTVGGFVYDFQTVPNNNGSQWLTILDVDYSVKDFVNSEPLFVTVTVAGAVPELCPASNVYGSQAACEYYLFGLGALYAECCPHSVSAWRGLKQPTVQALFVGPADGPPFTRGL